MNKEVPPNEATAPEVVIVGGGVGGLYTALRLAETTQCVITLYEAREFLGGRVETEEMEGFNAEFGPMRFEEKIQPGFVQLCEFFGIGRKEFPEPQAPQRIDSVLSGEVFEDPDKRPLGSLNLLRLGIYRMILGDHEPSFELVEERRIQHGDHEELARTWNVVPPIAGWLEAHRSDAALEDLRRLATFKNLGDRLLWKEGLTDVLEEVLGHAAVRKIDDEGTFYHLLPQNPNAIEWAIFWLRIFQLDPKEKLTTITKGVRTLAEELANEIGALGVRIRLSHQVTGLASAPALGRMIVKGVRHDLHAGIPFEHEADHVFLALPKAPLQKISSTFPADVREYIDRAVNGFQLLKVICIVDGWIWSRAPRPQEGTAWVHATRELHYFFSERGEEHRVLVLLYTDAPGSHSWDYHVVGSVHDRPELNGNENLAQQFIRMLLADYRRGIENELQLSPDFASSWSEVARTLEEIVEDRFELEERLGVVITPAERELLTDYNFRARHLRALVDLVARPEDLAADIRKSVRAYGIRDWSREPFGAASHVWNPGVASREVRDRLAAFPLEGATNVENVHICGEAYSDYQGFIEGALRSTEEALRRSNLGIGLATPRWQGSEPSRRRGGPKPPDGKTVVVD